MYTLTEITVEKENVTTHQELGRRFSVVERETSKNEFEKAYNAMYQTVGEKIIEEKDINPDIYCLVVTEEGRSIIPLLKKNFYYIVTENGNTFKNLTFKYK
jgi:hypothetical protein